MSEFLVEKGPASSFPREPGHRLDLPVWLRVIYAKRDYDFIKDEMTIPSPICRIDVLVGDQQRHVSLYAERNEPPSGSRMVDMLPWLPAPENIVSANMQVDKSDLVVCLRALADEIDQL